MKEKPYEGTLCSCHFQTATTKLTRFKQDFCEHREKRASNPEVDKEIVDSTALKPILTDFRKTHPNLRYAALSAQKKIG